MDNIRHRVDPGDIPPIKAARRLGLTLDHFREKLPELLGRGFPPADPTTGNFDLEAIDRWRADRYVRPQYFEDGNPSAARDARKVVDERLTRM